MSRRKELDRLTTRHAESRCVKCGAKFNASHPLGHYEAQPEAGDATLCIHCGTLHVFATDLTVRLATEEEEAEALRGTGGDTIRIARARILDLDATRRGRPDLSN